MKKRKLNNNTAPVPFFDLGKVLLEAIYSALRKLVDLEKKALIDNENYNIQSSNTELLDIFKNIFNKISRGDNPHITFGYTKNDNYEARATKIILQLYREVQNESRYGNGFCIPSPLQILYQILTIPDEPQSAAYSLIFCRSLLFETFKVFPEHPFTPEDFENFSISDVTNSLDVFTSYTVESNNISQTEKLPSQLMLAHYLAMKGIFYLRFGTTDRKFNKDKIRQIDEASKFLASQSISITSNKQKTYEFHKNSYYSELPDAATIMNELSGIPIPIRGAETILQGGLKTDSNSNLVIRVSGEPGSGKTSLALALCAVMSPFNTFSYYMSLEENAEDLRNRLESLIPFYLKRISIFNNNVNTWFFAEKIHLSAHRRLDDFESDYIDKITHMLEKKKQDFEYKTLPSVAPLIIVIDSIRILFNEENSLKLERFIDKCKKLNAIILLLSASDERFHNEIDYMVDLVIHLKHSGTESQNEKPIRLLQLTKTRHQVSRPGSHVFHLSGSKGFRISPQLPSQLDKKQKIVKPIPSNEYFIDFFDNYEKISYNKKKRNELKIWDKSRILLHGYGSSGKAGLALSILLSSIVDKNSLKKVDINLEKFRRKVLIISLLYPESYYKNLKRKIESSIISNTEELSSKITSIFFYSGYLTPEDFISRILRELDKAILEGEPYTGILIDGLHNVSLQFKRLQDNDMLWATLYNLLAMYNITILTTFTNFIIDNEKKRGSIDDDEILLKGHKPLLHALVEATDYHFSVQPADLEKEKIFIGKYIITLKSAIKHKLKGEKFVWDRENLKLSEYWLREIQQKIDFDNISD